MTVTTSRTGRSLGRGVRSAPLGNIDASQSADPCEATTTLPTLFDQLLSSVLPDSELLAALFFGPRRIEEADHAAHVCCHSNQTITSQTHRLLSTAATSAVSTNDAQVRHQAAPEQTVMAVPVRLSNHGPAAIAIVVPATTAWPQSLASLRLVARCAEYWSQSQTRIRLDAESEDLAATLELCSRVFQSDSLDEAGFDVCNRLQQHLGCRQVALAMIEGRTRNCRLLAISGTPRFDARLPATRCLEAAMDEAVLAGRLLCWPPDKDEERKTCLAHKTLVGLVSARSAMGIPLTDGLGQVLGALCLVEPTTQNAERCRHVLAAVSEPLGALLPVRKAIDGSRAGRVVRRLCRGFRHWKGLAATAAIVVAASVLAIPADYDIKARCTLEPKVRRFVAAPFDGLLARTLVEPGDLVQRGQVLAQLDDRDIVWDRAELTADRDQAVKRRDAAQVAHKYGAAQIATLEMQRLTLKIQTLDDRMAKLQIRSPIDGVITTGDLQRAEGAPMSKGQTLFEIAPLDDLVVEMAVSDEDVAFAERGLPMRVRLDAFPSGSWTTRSELLHPRSVIRDDENVFLLEARLPNSDGRLRPGMKGWARLVTSRHRLGWIWFHKPWQRMIDWLSW